MLAVDCSRRNVASSFASRSLSRKSGIRVADIGCGRGYTVNTLAASNPACTVLGLDYNPAHIAEARAAARTCIASRPP